MTCEVTALRSEKQPGHQPKDWTLLQPTQSSQLNPLSSRSSPLKTEKMDGEQGRQPKDWRCAGTRQDSKNIGLFRIGQCKISVHSGRFGKSPRHLRLYRDTPWRRSQINLRHSGPWRPFKELSSGRRACCDAATGANDPKGTENV